METIIDEIDRAVVTLNLSPEAMRHLQADESEKVFQSALNRFAASGDRRWWWEAFREQGASVEFKDGDGWKHLPQIAPNPSERVWFIAEDDQLSHYPVFETTPQVASAVIGECYGFEYYLIAKDLSWLVCETHHNVVCAVGQTVETRLLTHAV